MLSWSDWSTFGATASRAGQVHQPTLFADAGTCVHRRPQHGDEEEESTFAELGAHWELSESDLARLHGALFDACEEQLREAETPLDEVLDCLRWILSERSKDNLAFSFSNTLKLYGRPDAQAIREEIQSGLKQYLAGRLRRYPAWVAEAFWADPDRFAAELERNPQWINEGVRRQGQDGDLFDR
jgi:hypothetical protein